MKHRKMAIRVVGISLALIGGLLFFTYDTLIGFLMVVLSTIIVTFKEEIYRITK